ncbi:Hypothetical protein D9617_22g065950 [Elsinoe fawcettii]|nr:Hypothetical protein D9617_22g065950 [Elsinoe fawcettii]
MSLDSLSGELVDMIVRRSPFKDLCNIRLACSRLNHAATRRLFGELILKPTEESIQRWKAVAHDERLQTIPKSVTIWSYPDVDVRAHDDEADDSIVDEDDFFDAIGDLPTFCQVESVNLRSTADVCGNEEELWNDLFESNAYRLSTLKTIFTAVEKHNSSEGCKTVRDLTFRNLQNMPVPSLTTSACFKTVIQSLEGLHIQSTYEYNDAGPDHDLYKEERNKFHKHLLQDWIKPTSSHLKRLSLYDRTNWGLLPGYFPAENLRLPQLEELSLGYYTIARNNQIDWLFECKSLKKLNLHNVQVLSHAELGTESIQAWSVDTSQWQRVADPEHPDVDFQQGDVHGSQHFECGTAWTSIFDRIADDLPNLEEINIQYTDGWEPSTYDIEGRHGLSLDFSIKRYVGFWEGILPNPWPEVEDRHNGEEPDGSIEWCSSKINPHKEYLEEDKKAFDRMCEVVRQRRSKSGESRIA